MARPTCCKYVAEPPDKTCFKPQGMTASSLEKVFLHFDEYEAIRLADLEGLYQEQAAFKMNTSRQTFGRIIESARRKIADAIVNGKALKIEGGNVCMGETIQIWCYRCRKTFCFYCDTKDAAICPRCRKQAQNHIT